MMGSFTYLLRKIDCSFCRFLLYLFYLDLMKILREFDERGFLGAVIAYTVLQSGNEAC